MEDHTIYKNVADRYSATALAPSHASYGTAVARAFGYSAEELSSIPPDSNLGLSCGNPLALANLKGGETVVDLGCGAGFDCFLAARKVGENGKVIGVDMNEDMLSKARRNAEKAKVNNVEFLSSRITSIPLSSSTASVIISNCVINLVPHTSKPQVFHEIHRLLKPGGRVAISDILAKRDFTDELKSNVALYCGCVSGASKKEDYEQWMKEAGFENVVVLKDEGVDLNIYTQTDEGGEAVGAICCGPVVAETEAVEENGSSGGCCGPKQIQESNGDCGPAKKDVQGSCCAPAKKEKNSEGCGSAEVKEKNESIKGVHCGPKIDGGVIHDLKSLKDFDLNEWAGSYKIFAVKAV